MDLCQYALAVWIGDVELDDELVSAHRDGKLALFVGAGVSMAPPTNLPSFVKLVRHVAQVTGQDCPGYVKEAPDRALGALAHKPDVDVHRIIRDRIAEARLPSAVHRAIASLSSVYGSPRIVTTNYDQYLSDCLAEQFGNEFDEYVAPALPQGDAFTGIVYLHGSTGRWDQSLVATDEDFGNAYMQRRWAADFLLRMFSEYTVLFVGYSLQDTLMRYLALGLPTSIKRFALVKRKRPEISDRLGITEIPYRNHDALPALLREWTAEAQQGIHDHRTRVSNITRGAPPLSNTDDSYLRRVIADPARIRFFTEFARRPEWLSWVESLPEFVRLLDSHHVDSTDVDNELAWWFAHAHVANPNPVAGDATSPDAAPHSGSTRFSDEAAFVIARHGNTLSPSLWLRVIEALRSTGEEERSALLGLWVPLLVQTMPRAGAASLSLLLSACALPEDRESVLLLIERLTEPHREIKSGGPRDGQAQSETVLPDSWHGEFWNKLEPTDICGLASDLVPLIDRNLRKACRLERAARATEDALDVISFRRPTIETHEQNRPRRRSVNMLIDVARDVLEALLAQTPNHRGLLYLQLWCDADEIILRRLGVHGWIERPDVDDDARIDWLLSTGWIFDWQLRHETMRLVRSAVPGATSDAIDALVTHIRQGPSVHDDHTDRVIYEYLGEITDGEPASPAAHTAFEEMQSRHPQWQRREHPDFNYWSGPMQIVATPPDPEGMHARIEADLLDVVDDLRFSYLSSDGEAFENDLRSLRQTLDEHPVDGIEIIHVLTMQAAESALRADCRIAETVLSSWTRADLDSPIWRSMAEILPVALDCGRERWHSQPRFGPGSGIDIMTEAVNSWAGDMAQLWVRAAIAAHRSNADSWSGLPTDFRDGISDLMQSDDLIGSHARVILSNSLNSLHQLDANWATRELLPCLDPELDDERAIQCWTGFLYSGGANRKLLESGLLELYVKLIRLDDAGGTYLSRVHINGERTSRCYTDHLAGIAVYSGINPHQSGWLHRFIATATEELRVEWAQSAASLLRNLTISAVEAQWHSWMHPYWEDRRQSNPCVLGSDETAEMVEWIVTLETSFSDAVNSLVDHEQAGLPAHSHFLYRLSNPPEQDADVVTADPPETHPELTARLLTHLLTNTTIDQFASSNHRHVLRPVVDRLRGRVTSEQWDLLIAQMLRFGIQAQSD